MVARRHVFVGVAIVAMIALGAISSETSRATPARNVASHTPAQLVTAFSDVNLSSGSSTSELRKARAAGASALRLTLNWAAVSTGTPADPTNPADPAYDWSSTDKDFQTVAAQGMTVIADVVGAPAWAVHRAVGDRGPGLPNAAAMGEFAEAAAKHYDGSIAGAPAVHYWQVWNEPNLDTNLSPQLAHGVPVAPSRYRAMVNDVYDAVKRVDPANLVIAGGLAPFRDTTGATLNQTKDWGPLSFMRALLCLSPRLKPTCSSVVHFDIWSTHPYTSGGPTHHAVLPNDVSLGDLPEMSRALDAAERAHHIRAADPVQFWVTEFSWDSNPPDPRGVPTALLRRWVPQALYQMWSNGVSLVTWFGVRDFPTKTSYYQSGLYYLNGRAKPYLEGFRFPLVAFPRAAGVYVWGRTPFGKKGSVRIEQRTGSTWKLLGTVPSNRFGVFQRTLRTSGHGDIRGRLVATGERTLPFSLTPVPDAFYNPFGETTLLEPSKSHSKK